MGTLVVKKEKKKWGQDLYGFRDVTAIAFGSVRYADEVLHPKSFADAMTCDLVAGAVTYTRERDSQKWGNLSRNPWSYLSTGSGK